MKRIDFSTIPYQSESDKSETKSEFTLETAEKINLQAFYQAKDIDEVRISNKPRINPYAA